SNRNGNSEIYVMNSDGSGVVRLTFDPAVDTSPNWTLDGKVLFSSNRSGRFELYVANADGSDLQHLEINVDGNLTFPVASPEGHRIAFTGTNLANTRAVWIAHPDGTQPMQLAPSPLVGAFPD